MSENETEIINENLPESLPESLPEGHKLCNRCKVVYPMNCFQTRRLKKETKACSLCRAKTSNYQYMCVTRQKFDTTPDMKLLLCLLSQTLQYIPEGSPLKNESELILEKFNPEFQQRQDFIKKYSEKKERNQIKSNLKRK